MAGGNVAAATERADITDGDVLYYGVVSACTLTRSVKLTHMNEQ